MNSCNKLGILTLDMLIRHDPRGNLKCEIWREEREGRRSELSGAGGTASSCVLNIPKYYSYYFLYLLGYYFAIL